MLTIVRVSLKVNLSSHLKSEIYLAHVLVVRMLTNELSDSYGFVRTPVYRGAQITGFTLRLAPEMYSKRFDRSLKIFVLCTNVAFFEIFLKFLCGPWFNTRTVYVEIKNECRNRKTIARNAQMFLKFVRKKIITNVCAAALVVEKIVFDYAKPVL